MAVRYHGRDWMTPEDIASEERMNRPTPPAERAENERRMNERPPMTWTHCLMWRIGREHIPVVMIQPEMIPFENVDISSRTRVIVPVETPVEKPRVKTMGMGSLAVGTFVWWYEKEKGASESKFRLWQQKGQVVSSDAKYTAVNFSGIFFSWIVFVETNRLHTSLEKAEASLNPG